MNKRIEEILRNFSIDVKKELNDNLVAQYLFGSYLRGQENEFSDIDILVIVKKAGFSIREKLSELAADYSIKYGITISPVLKSIDVWEKNERYQTLFFREITHNGVKI
ncbi:MAG: nucleotidyltransferase domain-containing protein [Calditrichaeota bacterium]|nr:nucleotidyltransferase domain-containing protein [Calditrichota bacterium]